MLSRSAQAFLLFMTTSFLVAPIRADAQAAMGPLQVGVNYDQGDVYYTFARSAAQCADICLMDDRCIAMTYIVGSRQCWVKNRRSAPSREQGMVSALKQGVVPPPPARQ